MKCIRTALPLTLVLLLAACGGDGPTPTEPTPPDNPSDNVELVEFEVIRDDSMGRGVGIVRNSGSSNIESLLLSVTFIDKNSNIVASEYSYANLEVIQPGESSPFSIGGNFGDFERYEIGTEWRRTNDTPIREIAVVEAKIDKEKFNTYLRGRIVNNSGQNLEFVQVVYSCRNRAGKLVDANSDYTVANVLAPGVSSDFKAYLFADDANTCEAVAQGKLLD